MLAAWEIHVITAMRFAQLLCIHANGRRILRIAKTTSLSKERFRRFDSIVLNSFLKPIKYFLFSINLSKTTAFVIFNLSEKRVRVYLSLPI